jgi:hypothetical protein
VPVLKNSSLTLIAVLLSTLAPAEHGDPVNSPSSASVATSTEHDFDFLLGSWEFAAASKVPGVPSQYHGLWTAERIGAGTLVEDDYAAFDDRGHRVYLGVTIRAFDANARRWMTSFVEPVRYLDMRATKWSLGIAWRDGTEVREAPVDEPSLTRAHFFDIAPDHFSWSMDRSTDGGKTWDKDYLHVRAQRVGETPAN